MAEFREEAETQKAKSGCGCLLAILAFLISPLVYALIGISLTGGILVQLLKEHYLHFDLIVMALAWPFIAWFAFPIGYLISSLLLLVRYLYWRITGRI